MTNRKPSGKILIAILFVLLILIIGIVSVLLSRTHVLQLHATTQKYSFESDAYQVIECYNSEEYFDKIEPLSSGHIIRGGERASISGYWFTIAANVVCDYTGDFGILTN